MASGFSGGGGGGGGQDFFSGRPIATNTMNNLNMNMNNNNSNIPAQQPYRNQLPGVFLDQMSQIASRPALPSLIGKRTLADYQAQQQIHNNQALNALFLRSVKQRSYSPLSPLSPMDFSSSSANLAQRYGLPVLQQVRGQGQGMGMGGFMAGPGFQSNNQVLPTLNAYGTSFQNRVNPVPPVQDPEKNIMNQLQELEKQLFDDDEDNDVSVITNTKSEWSETIQSLINPDPTPSPPILNQNPVSQSPTSSSSPSSSSSSSAASPPSLCNRTVIMEVATAIFEGKTEAATEILSRLSQTPNPRTNSEQKLMGFMLAALKSRVNPVENPPPVMEFYGKDQISATQLLYELSPCFKLGFMAANRAIIEATLDDQEKNCSDGFHVIDLDVGQGGQYVNLLHALSTRQSRQPAATSTNIAVKITAVCYNVGGDEGLRAVGDLLVQLANKLGVCLKFNVVTISRLSDLTRESLGCEAEEPLAVNFAFKLYQMPDESVSLENPRDELLRRVKALSPRVVTLVEQEMNANTSPFISRTSEVCSYYGALLESIEMTVPKDNPDRVKAEEGLSRKLVNSIACEGRERVQRCEVFGKWKARMRMAGFDLTPSSHGVAESMRARLGSGNRVHPGFTVKEENGGVFFGWMCRSLTVASAWR